MGRKLSYTLGFFVSIFALFCGQFATATTHPAYISIIVDDLGNGYLRGKQVIDLPGNITCSFLPYRPYTVALARKASHCFKEVILHAPMQPIKHLPLGKGGLTIHMSNTQLDRTFLADFKAVPYAVGFNNHMGSLLTQNRRDMNSLMAEAKDLGIFYVDSKTTPHTIAAKTAARDDVPTTTRDVFLDDKRDTKYIAAQFRHFIHEAKRHGTAVAICHPYPTTIKLLRRELPRLSQHGVLLIPVSQIITLRQYDKGRPPQNLTFI